MRGMGCQMCRPLAARVPGDGTATVLQVDKNGWMARTTLETVLGQAGLRYSSDNFAEHSPDTYGESLKMSLNVPSSVLHAICTPTGSMNIGARTSGIMQLRTGEPSNCPPATLADTSSFCRKAILSSRKHETNAEMPWGEAPSQTGEAGEPRSSGRGDLAMYEMSC